MTERHSARMSMLLGAQLRRKWMGSTYDPEYFLLQRHVEGRTAVDHDAFLAGWYELWWR
jgi:hypothetical protein